MITLKVSWKLQLFGQEHEVGRAYVGWFQNEAATKDWLERLAQIQIHRPGALSANSQSLIMGDVEVLATTTEPLDLVQKWSQSLDFQLC